jgi:hypothetical protein
MADRRSNSFRRRDGLAPYCLLVFSLIAVPAFASPISATLEGCVLVTDPRLAEALWEASGTFQAVAFDDPFAGCETTIDTRVRDPFIFDENRVENTLKAWIDMSNLPTCGRRQYDLHYYLDFGELDPMGLKSLVVDTGVDCITFSRQPPNGVVPEPPAVALLLTGLVVIVFLRTRAG